MVILMGRVIHWFTLPLSLAIFGSLVQYFHGKLYALVDSWSFFCCTDYDDKAEDAVNFEDIDEEYDGPEVEATTEEDNVLSRKDYFSSNAVYASVNSTVSVFDEENYDEDDRMTNDIELHVKRVVQNCSSDGTEPNSKLFLCFFYISNNSFYCNLFASHIRYYP